MEDKTVHITVNNRHVDSFIPADVSEITDRVLEVQEEWGGHVRAISKENGVILHEEKEV